MVEINLIPDVKRELLRAQVLRNLIIAASTVVGIACIAIVVLTYMFIGGQEILKNHNKNTIESKFKELSSITDVQKTANIQSQLSEISNIRNNSPNTSRILGQIIVAIQTKGSNEVSFSSISYDPATFTLTIEGQAKGFPPIEAFRKTVAATKIIYRKEHKDVACTYDQAEKNEDGCISEYLVGGSSTTDDGLRLDQVKVPEQAYGDGENGEKIVRFKAVFKINENSLAFASKDFAVKSPSQTDVTDSKTEIPDNIFKADSTKEAEKEKKNE